METRMNPEMPKVPKAQLKTVEHQRNQFKSERDTLIDDLSWYKAKVSRLENSIKTLERKNDDIRTLNWELKGYADTYKEDSETYKTVLSEISQHIGNKPSSSTYKYFRAKLDGIGIKEGE